MKITRNSFKVIYLNVTEKECCHISTQHPRNEISSCVFKFVPVANFKKNFNYTKVSK